MLDQLLTEMAKVSPGVLAVVVAISGALGAIVAALLTGLLGKLLVTPFLSARDKQDREAEWRKHALELTKLDLERKLKSGRDFTTKPLRPSILDFLANYRDLQELGKKSPKDLYQTIMEKRTNPPPATATPSVAPASTPTNGKNG